VTESLVKDETRFDLRSCIIKEERKEGGFGGDVGRR
jgi:hypothetical protein